MVSSHDGKFSGLLKRTKTTGAGKRVKELPFHVSVNAWIENQTWMKRGMEALGRTLAGTYELLVPAGTSCGQAQEGVMTYQEAVAWSLEDKDGLRLAPCPRAGRCSPAPMARQCRRR